LQEKIKSDHLKIKSYTYLGLAYLKRGKNEEAEEALLEAIQTSERAYQPTSYREAYIALGDCYIKRGKVEEAIPIYEKALIMAQKKADREQERQIILKLAKCHEKRDEEKFREYLLLLYRIEVQGQTEGQIVN
jgi:tetratricopeptide (TPR) repeat protein